MERLLKIGDALSQLVNVAFLPNHRDTNANESISSRSHRNGWKIENFIDTLFFWQKNPGHCERSYYADLARAKETLEKHKGK